MSTCQACTSTAPDGVSICGKCETDTRARLRQQEFYRQELLTVLARLTRTQALNDGGRATSLTLAWAQMGDRFLDTIEGRELRKIIASLPPAWKAASALHSQRSLLVSWCRLLNEEAGVALPADSVAAMAVHVHDQMPILRKHEAAGELVAEVRAIVGRIVKVIDLPDERTRVEVGPCPNLWPNDEGQDEPCPGQVTAHVPVDVTAVAYMRCGACRAEWPSREWYITGPRIQARQEQLERQRKLAAQFVGKVAS
jgi:hypothetical protein